MQKKEAPNPWGSQDNADALLELLNNARYQITELKRQLDACKKAEWADETKSPPTVKQPV